MLWKSALGKEVVDTSTAETIGSLDGFVIGVGPARIVALVVGERIVTWDDAGGIGPDAVTLRDAGLLREPLSSVEVATVGGDVDPIKRTVLTDQGLALGPVSDIEFDQETGRVTSLIVSDAQIDGDRLLGVGSYAVVVADDR